MTDSKTATELLADMRDELLESCEYVGTMTERQGDVMRILGKYEQAIAAMLGNAERTCEMYQYRNVLGYINEYQCSECGSDAQWADDEPPNYCPNCGAKVVDR